jgi:hypothetical protein
MLCRTSLAVYPCPRTKLQRRLPHARMRRSPRMLKYMTKHHHLSTMDVLHPEALRAPPRLRKRFRNPLTFSMVIEIFLHCSRLQKSIRPSVILGFVLRSLPILLWLRKACSMTFLLYLLLRPWTPITTLATTRSDRPKYQLDPAAVLHHMFSLIASHQTIAEGHPEGRYSRLVRTPIP